MSSPKLPSSFPYVPIEIGSKRKPSLLSQYETSLRSSFSEKDKGNHESACGFVQPPQLKEENSNKPHQIDNSRKSMLLPSASPPVIITNSDNTLRGLFGSNMSSSASTDSSASNGTGECGSDDEASIYIPSSRSNEKNQNTHVPEELFFDFDLK